MTKVVNMRHESYDVDISRNSKWGNPFSHKKGTLAKFVVSSRKEAIEAHYNWVKFGGGKHLLDELEELRGKSLGCFCKPKLCHGDNYVRLLNETKEQLW